MEIFLDSHENRQNYHDLVSYFIPFFIKVDQCDDPPEKKPTKMAIGKINFLIIIVAITSYYQYIEKIAKFQ